MSQIDHDLRALKVEWIVARIVLALGVIVVIGVFTWIVLHRTPGATAIEGVGGSIASEGAAGAQDPAQQFCSSTLAVAQSFGIVPTSAKSGGGPQKTDLQGRYVCLAQNGAVHYTISVDLLCRNLGDLHCFNLFSISQDDGSVLFQRQG